MRNNDYGYLLNWRPLAKQDLNSIIQFIAKDNKERARSFGQTLYAKTLALKSHPLMGRVGRIPGMRELIVHKNYVVYYRLDKNIIEILRIRHTAENWP